MENLSRANVEAAVAEKAASDPAFRERLLADPRAAIAEVTGMELPAAVRVTIHEESLTDVHLVIPNDSDALDENDLELVAGGVCWDDSLYNRAGPSCSG